MSDEIKYKVVFNEFNVLPGNCVSVYSDMGLIATAGSKDDTIEINRLNTWDLDKVTIANCTAEVATDDRNEYYEYAVNSCKASRSISYYNNIIDFNYPIKLIGTYGTNNISFLKNMIETAGVDTPVYVNVEECCDPDKVSGEEYTFRILREGTTSKNSIWGWSSNNLTIAGSISSASVNYSDIKNLTISPSSSISLDLTDADIENLNFTSVTNPSFGIWLSYKRNSTYTFPKLDVNKLTYGYPTIRSIQVPEGKKAEFENQELFLNFGSYAFPSPECVTFKNITFHYPTYLGGKLEECSINQFPSNVYVQTNAVIDNLTFNSDLTNSTAPYSIVNGSSNFDELTCIGTAAFKLSGVMPKKLVGLTTDISADLSTSEFFMVNSVTSYTNVSEFSGLGLVVNGASKPEYNIFTAWEYLEAQTPDIVNFNEGSDITASPDSTYTFTINKSALEATFNLEKPYVSDIINLGYTVKLASAYWQTGSSSSNYAKANITESDDILTLSFNTSNFTNYTLLGDSDYISLQVDHYLGGGLVNRQFIKVSPNIVQSVSFDLEKIESN